ncbi:MAG: hypothetical protein ACP5HK_06540, partial [Acidilobus sp.]
HEDLLEGAVGEIVRAAENPSVESPAPRRLLTAWRRYGLGFSISGRTDAVKYLLVKYGERLKGEITGLPSDCRGALGLALGAARTGQPLRWVLRAHREGRVNKLVSSVREALYFLGDPSRVSGCAALRLLMSNGELTQLGVEILLTPRSADRSTDNPFLDVLLDIDWVKGGLRELLDSWENRRVAYPAEEIYGMGLATLSAYAAMKGVEDRDLAAKALRAAAPWGISYVAAPEAVISTLNLLSPLGASSPDEWAHVLAVVANILTDHLSISEYLSDMVELTEGLLRRFNELNDFGRVHLIRATARAYVRLPRPEGCPKLKNLLERAREIHSEPLRLFAEGYVLYGLDWSGFGCGIDLVNETEGLIERLEEALKSGELRSEWLRDGQLLEFLNSTSLRRPEEAFTHRLKVIISLLYLGASVISLKKREWDNAVMYLERSKEGAREQAIWDNYIVGYNHIVRVKALKAGSVKDLVNSLAELKDVFAEATHRLRPTARGNFLSASLLAQYLVYLGLSGRAEEARELYREFGHLLYYLPPGAGVSSRLLLNLLGVLNERPCEEDLLKAVITRRPMRPALMVALGLDVDCERACEGVSDEAGEVGACVRICGNLRLALRGDERARDELLRELRSQSKDYVIDHLSKYGPKAVVEALSALKSHSYFVLALHELLSGDLDAVKAIAERGQLAHFAPSEEFGALRDAVERKDEEGLRLALAKLYYYHY